MIDKAAIEAPWSKRFWARVRKSNGCWLWTGAKNNGGYGVIRYPGGTKAHRASWVLHYGPIPKGRLVCHSCDEPACVNPEHLWLGTNAQNMADCWRKGRGATPCCPPSLKARGEQNGYSKLKEKQILQIREDSRPQAKIAVDYGVAQSTIGKIKNNRLWAHVGENQDV